MMDGHDPSKLFTNRSMDTINSESRPIPTVEYFDGSSIINDWDISTLRSDDQGYKKGLIPNSPKWPIITSFVLQIFISHP
jgi:hypothetical protein